MTDDVLSHDGTVGPLDGIVQHPVFMQFTGCEKPDQYSYWSENACDYGNDMRNAICVEPNVLK